MLTPQLPESLPDVSFPAVFAIQVEKSGKKKQNADAVQSPYKKKKKKLTFEQVFYLPKQVSRLKAKPSLVKPPFSQKGMC